jgi:hypothetical protein
VAGIAPATWDTTSGAKSFVIDAYFPERGDFIRLVLNPFTGRAQAANARRLSSAHMPSTA